MTTQATFHLSAESIDVLRSLKGKTWRLATGKLAPEKPGHHFAWDNVIVATDGGETRIHTELVESDFEGYDEEYAQLSVHSDSHGLAEAQRDGRVCFEHAGARITEVFLIRISITQMMRGESTWTYSGDYGVVFGLTKGAAAVRKTGHHTDALDVCRRRLKDDPLPTGWVLVNLATPTDCRRLTARRKGRRGNGP